MGFGYDTYTDKTSKFDQWHVTFWFLDGAGNTVLTIHWDSRRMYTPGDHISIWSTLDDDVTPPDAQPSFVSVETYHRIARVVWRGYC